MNPVVYRLATWYTQFVLLPLYARIRVAGLENVPMTGPLVIASNHLNDADPGVIATRIRRPIAFMAKAELFRVPLLAQFLLAYGTIPVRRNAADLTALRRANEALQKGLTVCIFPEGRRSGKEAALREGWPGAAVIALRNDVPILPIAITGSQRLSVPLMFLHLERRDDVTLTIGEPFHLPKTQRLNEEAARAGTELIMRRIAALLPPENRGYYGDEAASNRQQATRNT